MADVTVKYERNRLAAYKDGKLVGELAVPVSAEILSRWLSRLLALGKTTSSEGDDG